MSGGSSPSRLHPVPGRGPPPSIRCRTSQHSNPVPFPYRPSPVLHFSVSLCSPCPSPQSIVMYPRWPSLACPLPVHVQKTFPSRAEGTVKLFPALVSYQIPPPPLSQLISKFCQVGFRPGWPRFFFVELQGGRKWTKRISKLADPLPRERPVWFGVLSRTSYE